MNLEMYDRALSCCEEALKIDPDHANTLHQKEEVLKIIKLQEITIEKE